MRLTTASRKAIAYACMHYHYSKKIPVNPLGYNVYNDTDEWCGVVLFGYGANNQIGTPYGLAQGQCLELTRVALNGKQEHTSQCISMALKQLKKDCPLCKLVVSYADIDQNHLGTIYQATNWIYVGDCMVNSNDESVVINGKRMHGKSVSDYLKRITGGGKIADRLQFIREHLDKNAYKYITAGKRKYLYPMDKRIRKKIMVLMKPYPKTDEDWKKIDRTQFLKKNSDDDKN